MHYDGMGFFGMHALWWLFWIAFAAVIFALARGDTEKQKRKRETPLELLQRRYAAGEISSEEYTERKARLEEDR